jgi:hypothetical protein
MVLFATQAEHDVALPVVQSASPMPLHAGATRWTR